MFDTCKTISRSLAAGRKTCFKVDRDRRFGEIITGGIGVAVAAIKKIAALTAVKPVIGGAADQRIIAATTKQIVAAVVAGELVSMLGAF